MHKRGRSPDIIDHHTLLACEQTHNTAGGTIWPLEQLQAVCQAAHDHG